MPPNIVPAVKWTKVDNGTFKSFAFKNIAASVGDFVLISNVDAENPDTEEGCLPAQIISLFEDPLNTEDPYKAKVLWYSRPKDLPQIYFKDVNIDFNDKELVEDHRPYHSEVSIETFFSKCTIKLTSTKENDWTSSGPCDYLCRYRIVPVNRNKVKFEPVLEEERNEYLILNTPTKNLKAMTPKTPSTLIKVLDDLSLSGKRSRSSRYSTPTKNKNTETRTPRTPTTVTKGLEQLSLSAKKSRGVRKSTPLKNTLTIVPQTPNVLLNNLEKKTWSVTKSNGTKLLFKCSPEPPKIISMRLIEKHKSVPTLVIKQKLTPCKSYTEKEGEKANKLTSSGRVVRCPKYFNEEVSSPGRTQSRRLTTDSEGSDYDNKHKRSSRASKLESPQNHRRVLITDSPKRKIPSLEGILSTPKSSLPTIPENCETGARRARKSYSFLDSDDDQSRSPIRNKSYDTRKLKTPAKTPNKSSHDRDDDFELETPSRKLRTQAKTLKKYSPDSDDDFEHETTRRYKSHATRKSKTPQQSARKIFDELPKIRELPSSLQRKGNCFEKSHDFIKGEDDLPGRGKELVAIIEFLTYSIIDCTSALMFVSGIPGTGKTSTVNKALQFIKEDTTLPDYKIVECNGMKIVEPKQLYVKIHKELTGKKVSCIQASKSLNERFATTKPGLKPTVLIIDEFDALCLKKNKLLYNLINWTNNPYAALTVVTISNTMDLAERNMSMPVVSRMGVTRLTFTAYSHEQLQAIVETRLNNCNVTRNAIELISRKVAAASGDVRFALRLCSAAARLAQAASESVDLKHVERALDEALVKPNVHILRNCAPAAKIVLRAIAAEIERTGLDETTLSRVVTTSTDLFLIEGRPYKSAAASRGLKYAEVLEICRQLYAFGLLTMNWKDVDPTIFLNVDVEDVHYAFKQIKL